MRIAVTGAGGFIGRELLAVLNKNDVMVTALTRNADGREDTDLCVWRSTDYSLEGLKEVLAGADAVIHLAGIKGTKTELSDYDGDMQMCANILDAMSDLGIGRMVYASSRLVYGNPDNVPWTEETAPEPVLSYAKNKVRCEKLILDWAEATDSTAVILRIAQVLGKGEGTRNMINVFQDLARAGGELKVIGKSVARRQYIYTKDLAEIIWRAASKEDIDTGIINAGMTEAYTNLEIAQAINKAFHNDTPINYDDSAPETITPSYMDISKMLKITEHVPMDMAHALEDMY